MARASKKFLAAFLVGISLLCAVGVERAESISTQCNLYKTIDIQATAAGQTKLVTGVATRLVKICSFHLFNGPAQNAALIEGTQTTNPCDTAPVGMSGGNTAVKGWQFTANNASVTMNNGNNAVMTTTVTGNDVCLIYSGVASGQFSGTMNYTIE